MSGPAVRVVASAAGRRIASGTQADGWAGGIVLTLPLRPIARQDALVRLCVTVAPGSSVAAIGSAPSDRDAARGVPPRLRIEYLRAGRPSWWAFASTIVTRMGLGHAWSGPSVALVIAALTLAAAILGLRQLLRPRAAWICALVGTLNAAAWSLLIPPFQLPDEPAQYAYAEHVAQTGAPPAERAPEPLRLGFSQDELIALRDLRAYEIGGRPANAGVWSQLEQRRLTRDLGAGPSRRAEGYSFGATPQPPLYYALAAVPYRIGSGGTTLTRLALMRLLSALLGGLTVLFTFLFLREALPASPWTWTVGALGVAFQPMFASITGGVNPDALLFTVSAALFLCVARAFRRGLTPRLAAATGAVMAVGMIGKLNVLGLLPGAAVGIAIAAVRSEHAAGLTKLRTLRLPALAVAVAAAPVLLVAALNAAAWRRPAVGLVSAQGGAFALGTPTHRLSYLWQVYLPRLPRMQRLFPYATTRRYFNEFIGAFGGIDTRFPHWLNDVALVLATLVAVLAARALVDARARLRSRRGELLAYALMALGLLGIVGAQYYAFDTLTGRPGAFQQVRYLLPLAPFYGALLVLAARGAGRRLLPVSGTLLVVLALAHDVLAQLLAVGRYYA